MQQLLSVWNALSLQRKIIVVGATVIMFLSVLGLSRMASQPTLSLLYSGLDEGAAGEVVTALMERGIVHEVRGGAIYVDAAQRDSLRMTLATEGLPSTAGRGYELLDGLSGFGTTSQMFDAAYWRAKEGELARTIVVNTAISSARVHIASIDGNPFRTNVRPTASVTVTTVGAGLTQPQARAMRYMVASAVAGMTPDDVSIIDTERGLIGPGEGAADPATDNRGEALRDSVLRLLEARVGRGNAVVELSVDTVTESESIRERRVDPETRVVISSDTEERSNSSRNGEAGDVTVASNIPDGDAAGGQDSSSQNSETRERVNYEVSQTEREILRSPGAVRRVTVAVMVNGVPGEGDEAGAAPAAGQTGLVPRGEDELAVLRELVASAVGFDEARGDVITVRSLVFQPSPVAGTEVAAATLAGPGLDMMTLIQTLVLAVVALIVALFVVRPLLSGSRSATAALPAPGRGLDNRMDPDGLPPLNGEIDGPDFMSDGLPALMTPQPMGFGTAPFADDTPADPVDRLRRLISERKDESLDILQSWLEDRGEKTS